MSTSGLKVERKKGRVSNSGHFVKRDSATGKFVDTKHRGKNPRITSLVGEIAGVKANDGSALLVKIRKGLNFNAVLKLEKALESSRKEMAVLLSIPTSTLTRRKNEDHLQVDESDRVIRLAKLVDAAKVMMEGDKDAALAWLKSPLEILGNETPLQHAQTELGARDVEDLIGRIRHGVFS